MTGHRESQRLCGLQACGFSLHAQVLVIHVGSVLNSGRHPLERQMQRGGSGCKFTSTAKSF